MTTYNTGNPLGSVDVKDLYDNAENLDVLVNTQTELTNPDRFGVDRKTWKGMETEFVDSQADKEDRFQEFLADSAYQPLGAYAAGIEVTAYNQVILDNGEYWRLSASTPLPYTTTGAGMPEGGSFVGVGDAVLRQDLADPAKGSELVAYQPAGTGAVPTDVQSKLRESVSVKDFGAVGDGVTDDTAAIQAASLALANAGGGILYFPEGQYNYTRLTIRGRVIFQGEGPAATFLVCTDSTTIDSGILLGSSMRALDNNIRVVYSGFRDLSIYAGSTSGVSAQQDIFQNIIGLNLCMCERTIIENVGFGGWGQGAIVLARAEAGAEGLGFVSSTQDGNYNHIQNINMASCGKYNTATSALWFKYKANSNKLYAIFAKGMTGSYLAGIEHGNDNAFFGGTLESAVGVANLGFGVNFARGNLFTGFRIEVCTGDGYVFGANATDNTVIAGYHTGVSGQDFNLVNPDNRVISNDQNYLRIKQFPPSSSYSVFHNQGALKITSVNGDPDYPLYVKSATYNDFTKYPYQLFWSDVQGGAAGNILGRLGWRNSDTSTGAAGVSGAIDGILEGSAGQTGLAFYTGTGTTVSERLRLTSTGVLRPATDNTQTLGAAANRWSTVFAGTGTINTSDEREKQDIAALDEAEQRVAVALKGLVKKFRFRDAVAEKGESARIHIGVIAQEVIAAFSSEGLDPMRYGIICYDEWDEQVIEHQALYDYRPTGEINEGCEEIYSRTMVREARTEVRPAGNRYGVRHDELLAFIIAAM